MPELPEVQTTVNRLDPVISGEVINGVWMDQKKPVHTGSNMAWSTMKQKLPGRKIKNVTRRAKFIVINFIDGASLWIHQKMTGHLLVGRWVFKKNSWVGHTPGPIASDPMNRHIRLLITFKGGNQLALSDARRFARIIFVPTSDSIGQIKEIALLGPEPLTLRRSDFEKLIMARKGMIKPTLTDPAVIVGIGNIYADEILFRAGIHPFAPISGLSKAQIGKIYAAMIPILKAAIRAGGSSVDDYRMPDGDKGRYQNSLKVYQHTGTLCSLCGRGTIKRIVRNGRSSHFCPAHQKIHG